MSVSVIGDWDFFWNFDGSGDYYQTTMTVNSDGTFTDGTGGTGSWSLVGTIFHLNYTNSYQYSGLFSGAVVCGFNGATGNPTPPETAFYFIKKDSGSAADAVKGDVRTVP